MKLAEKYKLLKDIRAIKDICIHNCETCEDCELEDSLVKELKGKESRLRHTKAECWNYLVKSKAGIKTFKKDGYTWVWCPIFVIRVSGDVEFNLSRVQSSEDYKDDVVCSFNTITKTCKNLEYVRSKSELWFEKKSHDNYCMIGFMEKTIAFDLRYFTYLYTLCGDKESEVFTGDKCLLIKNGGMQVLLMGCKGEDIYKHKNVVLNYRE